MSVIEAVLSFDGKHVDELRHTVEGFTASDGPMLIELCSSEDPAHRVAATWIVKALLKNGRDSSLDLRRYFSRLSAETDWGALLHLLQSVEHAPEPASDHRQDILKLMDHRKTLVAVWALDAIVRVALETGDGLEEARRLVAAALGHDKASMRARARHLAPLLGL